MAKKSYKKKQIKREGLLSKIESFFTLKNKPVKNINIERINDTCEKIDLNFSDKNIKFNIFNTSKGMTISFSQYGVDDETIDTYLTPMVEWLVENHSYSAEKNSFTVSLTYEDFEFLINILSDKEFYNFEIISNDSQEDKHTIKIKSEYNDNLTLTFYKTTNHLFVQGKALQCYWATYSTLSQTDAISISIPDQIKIINNGINKEIPSPSLDTTIETQIKFYKKLEDDCKQMLRVYFLLKNCCIKEIENYNFLVFDILRMAESILRKYISKQLIAQNLFLDEKNFSFTSNDDDDNKPVFLKKRSNYEFNSLIDFDLPIVKDNLEDLYNHYYNNRNSLFHGKEDGVSRIIKTHGEALSISEKTISLLNNLFN